jgi:UDP-glucose 4-epimerase
LEAGYDVTCIDNLINSTPHGLDRVREITKCDEGRLSFIEVDLCDQAALEEVFKNAPTTFCGCIHFAGLKAVGESVSKPLLYYENNLGSTFGLLKCMEKYDCPSIIFSSSATVYVLCSTVLLFFP